MRIVAPLIAAAAIAAIAGCASTGTTTAAAGAQPSSAPSAPSSSSPPSCADQFASWRDSGGLDDLQAVQGDLGTVATAASASAAGMETGSLDPEAQAALQQAAAALQSDTATAQAGLPPSCVPGLRRDVSAALTDYNKAAVEAGQSATEADSGNYAVATSDIVAAGKALGAGNGKIGKATKAIQAFTG